MLMQSNVMSIKVIYSVVISTCVMYIVPTCMYQRPIHTQCRVINKHIIVQCHTWGAGPWGFLAPR